MHNGVRLAGYHAGQRWTLTGRFARCAAILDLLALFFFDDGDLSLGQRVKRVESDLKDACRTSFHTGPAASAFVGVNLDEVLAGTVFVAIMG
jgi:hypothetical protein